MEKEPKVENKELKKISKIHFLIHPGFLSDERQVSEVKEKYIELLGNYVEKAKSLKEDEVMFAFLHKDRKEIKKDLEAEDQYATFLKELRKILGRRLVVSVGDIVNEVPATHTLSDVQAIAAARGYRFDPDVLSEAYGELLGMCVRMGAGNLNRAAGLRNKTVVNPELTDARMMDSERRQRRLDSIKKGEGRLVVEE